MQKILYVTHPSFVVTKSILTKLLIPRRFVKNTEFHENPTNILVFDTTPQRDIWTKMLAHTENLSSTVVKDALTNKYERKTERGR
jgi:hypothetical protein